MELFALIDGFFADHRYLEFFLRIILASVCGAIIGFERSKRFKEAGIRTLCIVACVSALLMIISKYGFADLLDASGAAIYATNRPDPARIAAQVVSGIGFIGAGVIFKTGSYVRGLTTAACIWASASVGMSIGCGLYALGFFTAIAIVLFQYLLHRFTAGMDGYTTGYFTIVTTPDSTVLGDIREYLIQHKLMIVSSTVRRTGEDQVTIELDVRMRADIDLDDLMAMMKRYPEISAVSA